LCIQFVIIAAHLQQTTQLRIQTKVFSTESATLWILDYIAASILS